MGDIIPSESTFLRIKLKEYNFDGKYMKYEDYGPIYFGPLPHASRWTGSVGSEERISRSFNDGRGGLYGREGEGDGLGDLAFVGEAEERAGPLPCSLSSSFCISVRSPVRISTLASAVWALSSALATSSFKDVYSSDLLNASKY